MVRVMDVVPTLYRVRDAVKSDLSAKEVRLTLTVPTEGLSCAHDPATLEHALLAMVVNAIEASPLGGEIELRAEQGTARPQNGAVERRDSNIKVCRISVYDRGIGLPMDQPEKVFDFSYSTKQKGMGLGLALARQALQRQGGVAHAENNPEGGAHVFVELPLEWQPGKQ
jgi:signal transduction histidine kinase